MTTIIGTLVVRGANLVHTFTVPTGVTPVMAGLFAFGTADGVDTASALSGPGGSTFAKLDERAAGNCRVSVFTGHGLTAGDTVTVTFTTSKQIALGHYYQDVYTFRGSSVAPAVRGGSSAASTTGSLTPAAGQLVSVIGVERTTATPTVVNSITSTGSETVTTIDHQESGATAPVVSVTFASFTASAAAARTATITYGDASANGYAALVTTDPSTMAAARAAGTGSAHQPAVATTGGGTTAVAGSASGTGTSASPAVALAAAAGHAAGTGTAAQTSVRLAATAGLATGAGAAATTSVTLTAAARRASGSGAASPASVVADGSASAGHAAGSGSAHPPALTTSLIAAAAHASGAGSAHQVAVSAVASVGAPAGHAVGTGQAHAGAVTTAGSAPAGAAAGTAAAHQPDIRLSLAATLATATGSAHAPGISIATAAALALGTGSAVAPDVSTSGTERTAVAAPAVGIGQAHEPAVFLDSTPQPERGSWWGLLAILRVVHAEAAPRPQSCPNDGTPYEIGARGELFCPFDGYRPGTSVGAPPTNGGDWGGLAAVLDEGREYAGAASRTAGYEDPRWGPS
jgi:hypothetical protein